MFVGENMQLDRLLTLSPSSLLTFIQLQTITILLSSVTNLNCQILCYERKRAINKCFKCLKKRQQLSVKVDITNQSYEQMESCMGIEVSQFSRCRFAQNVRLFARTV